MVPDEIKCICPDHAIGPPFKNNLLLDLAYIHKCKAEEGLRFIKEEKNVRFPECLTQSDVWHSCEQTPARGKSVLVPCLVDRTYLGH